MSKREEPMSAVELELKDRLAQLGPEDKRKVLEYVRSLEDGSDLPPTASGADLLRFAGSIPKEDLDQMWATIQEAREASMKHGW